tara:strand:- start:357 stop:593 length:237 start_codon:yes stop_codon:yes gene_type:complete
MTALEWIYGMRQNIDQTSVENIRENFLRNLSFAPVDIKDLIGWSAQPALVVSVAILGLEIAGLVTRHYVNRVACSVPQ